MSLILSEHMIIKVTKFQKLILKIILLIYLFQAGYEVKCRCHQTIGGLKFKVPCNWSGLPQCNRNHRPPVPVRPEYGEQCGPLSDRNGIWKCDSKTCYLHCNHGYIATDFGE